MVSEGSLTWSRVNRSNVVKHKAKLQTMGLFSFLNRHWDLKSPSTVMELYDAATNSNRAPPSLSSSAIDSDGALKSSLCCTDMNSDLPTPASSSISRASMKHWNPSLFMEVFNLPDKGLNEDNLREKLTKNSKSSRDIIQALDRQFRGAAPAMGGDGGRIESPKIEKKKWERNGMAVSDCSNRNLREIMEMMVAILIPNGTRKARIFKNLAYAIVSSFFGWEDVNWARIIFQRFKKKGDRILVDKGNKLSSILLHIYKHHHLLTPEEEQIISRADQKLQESLPVKEETISDQIVKESLNRREDEEEATRKRKRDGENRRSENSPEEGKRERPGNGASNLELRTQQRDAAAIDGSKEVAGHRWRYKSPAPVEVEKMGNPKYSVDTAIPRTKKGSSSEVVISRLEAVDSLNFEETTQPVLQAHGAHEPRVGASSISASTPNESIQEGEPEPHKSKGVKLNTPPNDPDRDPQRDAPLSHFCDLLDGTASQLKNLVDAASKVTSEYEDHKKKMMTLVTEYGKQVAIIQAHQNGNNERLMKVLATTKIVKRTVEAEVEDLKVQLSEVSREREEYRKREKENAAENEENRKQVSKLWNEMKKLTAEKDEEKAEHRKTLAIQADTIDKLKGREAELESVYEARLTEAFAKIREKQGKQYEQKLLAICASFEEERAKLQKEHESSLANLCDTMVSKAVSKCKTQYEVAKTEERFSQEMSQLVTLAEAKLKTTVPRISSSQFEVGSFLYNRDQLSLHIYSSARELELLRRKNAEARAERKKLHEMLWRNHQERVPIKSEFPNEGLGMETQHTNFSGLRPEELALLKLERENSAREFQNERAREQEKWDDERRTLLSKIECKSEEVNSLRSLVQEYRQYLITETPCNCKLRDVTLDGSS